MELFKGGKPIVKTCPFFRYYSSPFFVWSKNSLNGLVSNLGQTVSMMKNLVTFSADGKGGGFTFRNWLRLQVIWVGYCKNIPSPLSCIYIISLCVCVSSLRWVIRM